MMGYVGGGGLAAQQRAEVLVYHQVNFNDITS